MAANTIRLAGDFRHEEYVATATIKPGQLLMLEAAGEVKLNDQAGGDVETMVAVEDALQGNTIDDSYATDALVMCNIPVPGAVMQLWLEAGEDIDIGDRLVSHGDGNVVEDGHGGVTTKKVVAVALEALDLSGSGAVDTLLKCRII